MTAVGDARIADIELLRGLAVMAVVLHHVNGNLLPAGVFLPSFFGLFGGWSGVDLFFCISGFVIARGLLPAIGVEAHWRGRLRVTGMFWLRRAYRLLPAAWLWLLLSLLLSWCWNSTGVFGTVEANIDAGLAGALQYANLRFAELFGKSFYGATFVYWSLALEWQFYLLLPILVMCMRRWMPMFLIAWIIFLLVTERGIYGMSFRTDALAWGVLLAMASGRAGWSTWRAQVSRFRFASVVGVVAALGFIVLLGSPLAAAAGWRITVIAVLAALVVAVAATGTDVLGGVLPLPLRRAGEWLGEHSYAIYLCHVPLMFLVRESAARADMVPAERPLFTLLVYSVLLFSAATVTYRLVEMPWRDRGRRLASPAVSQRGVKGGAVHG